MVERKNISIVGVARVILHDQGLTLQLWVEVCNTIVYLQNKIPNIIFSMITPKEAFSRRKPDVSHFKNFGAIVYCRVSKDSNKKLEPTAEMGVFLGYTETPHNYMVYFPSLRVIVLRRDVNLDEEMVMRCSLKRELIIPQEEELLVFKEELHAELQDVVEQPHVEEQTGGRVEAPTQP